MNTPAVPTPPRVSRRDLLRLAGGLAGGALIGSGLAASPARATPTRRSPGRTGGLAEPEVIRSRGGVLDTTLRVTPAAVEIGGQTRHVLTYNGQLPGPTLVAHPGDLLRIRLVNEIGVPTNLHTHGLHVSGEGNSDNIFIRVDPGQDFLYEIPLRRDHHTGTNWYHPHFHGTGAQQVFAGVAGALIVEGRRETPQALGISRDRVMALSAMQFDEDGGVIAAQSSLQSKQVALLNGQLEPTIDIAPDEVQRWRLINTSVNTVLRLQLDGDHTMTQVAADGNGYDEPEVVDEVVLASGQRADVLVRGGSAGTSALRVMPFDIGFGVVVPEALMATVDCRGPRQRTRPLHLAPLRGGREDLRDEPVAVRRELAMTMEGGFGIDGKSFNADRIDQVIDLDAVEEWTVHNPTGLVHPFHIHVNPFQVTHVDGVPVDAPSWEDTVIVDKNGGSITFRTRFRDFLGRAIFHCHFVTHAELGMMGIAEIVDPSKPRPTPTVDPNSPFSCWLPSSQT